ncbi:MAG TPA: hypothetical protein PK299_15660 [Anaerolineales bacterium]|nr:hypothetical protein [Anaerolineales bacterium]
MKTLRRIDTALFALLTLFLLTVVTTSGMANLQTDAVDYYAMVQRLVGDTPDVVPNLPFVEQRSPGYPLITVPVYYALGVFPSGTVERVPSTTANPATGTPSPQARCFFYRPCPCG